MLGLELTFNGKTLMAAMPKGVSTVIATQVTRNGVNEIELNFSGLNSDKQHVHLTWLNEPLKEGDEFTVKVKEIDQNSEPISTRTEKDLRCNITNNEVLEH